MWNNWMGMHFFFPPLEAPTQNMVVILKDPELPFWQAAQRDTYTALKIPTVKLKQDLFFA